MGESVFSERRMYYLLLTEVILSLIVANIYTQMTGFYTFTALFLSTVLLIALNNIKTLDASLGISSSRLRSWFVFLLSSVALAFVFENVLEFPSGPSIGLAVSIMLYVYWTHYSLEPLRD